MKLIRHPVGAWSMNAYALICQVTGSSVLIDPGDEPAVLLKMLADSRPEAILITHRHLDHIDALKAMQDILNVPVMVHPGRDMKYSPIMADRWLSNGDKVSVGNHFLNVFHTPGHTEDQVCFAIQDDSRVIVGDTIFEGGPGKTFSVEDFKQTLNTLKEVVLQWPDETICYPGHGPSFCLGDKRGLIEGFISKDHGEFFGDATWEM